MQTSKQSFSFLLNFLQDCKLQAQKRGFFARLPSRLEVGSSKPQICCETLQKVTRQTHAGRQHSTVIRFTDFRVDASKVFNSIVPAMTRSAQAYEVQKIATRNDSRKWTRAELQNYNPHPHMLRPTSSLYMTKKSLRMPRIASLWALLFISTTPWRTPAPATHFATWSTCRNPFACHTKRQKMFQTWQLLEFGTILISGSSLATTGCKF